LAEVRHLIVIFVFFAAKNILISNIEYRIMNIEVRHLKPWPRPITTTLYLKKSGLEWCVGQTKYTNKSHQGGL